jgi:hypothetical protein
MRIFHIAIVLLVATLTARQQSATASLEGIVVRAGSNEPVPKASVELRNATGNSLDTTADAEGRFFFPSVSPGVYRLVSSKAGYVDQQYGQRLKVTVPVSALSLSASPSVTLTGGERRQGVRIEMVRAGVISGRVVVRGKPVGNIDVKALKSSYELGQRVFTTVLSGRTDDLGDYRIFWLPAGQYYVVADVLELQAAAGSQSVMTGLDPASNPFFTSSINLRYIISRAIGAGGNDATMFVSMYPPGVPDWRDSTPIVLGEGSEVSGVNIQVNPVPSLHVRGSITGAPATPGRPSPVPSLSLVPVNAATNLGDAGITVITDANGNFDFSRVSPGAYRLSASLGSLHGRVSVDVRDRDINNVIVPLNPGVNITGRVVFEGTPAGNPDPRLSQLRISLLDDVIGGGFRQVNRNMATAMLVPRADGSFTIPAAANAAIATGNYHVLVGPILTAAAGWASPPASIPVQLMPAATVPPILETTYVKSIRMGDLDVLNDGLRLTSQPGEPLVILVGTNPGSLEGRVVNSRQQPAEGSTVVLVPESGLQFRTNHKFTSTDASGRFHITKIPPGEYSVYAWDDVEPGAWQDPDFIRAYRSRAVSVHINEGRASTIDPMTLP